MIYKKLESPEFRVTVGDYILVDGISVESFSDRSAKADWCRVILSDYLESMVTFSDMADATVEIGYDDDFDVVMTGNVRKISGDYWKEIIIKDDIILLERTIISATFLDCTPQDIVRYVLVQAGITEYEINDTDYGKKAKFSIPSCNAVTVLKMINEAWNINNDYFFKQSRFYWGKKPEQRDIYTIEQGNTILSLNKYGSLWEAETVVIPWIHHSEMIEIIHSKISGEREVEKVIIKKNEKGIVRQYIYFK